jgi:hypothetical protein
MADDIFDGPGSASGVVWADLEGRLLLIKPLSAEKVQTAFGESDCVRADVAVLDGDEQDEHNDTLVFPKVLSSQIRSNIGTGRMNLGRLGKGTAKPGQSAPWLLSDPTDADKTVARAWIKANEPVPF